ncbi:MAG TPA: ParB/RepB/Spo0J family partition protein [Geminicoccus sp.]|jgi:ParB family chromosome partitioning protein|uniref:ParB/RepB/Spo0J family partition protein n=1 Tax=Geminicoccus sp. TaxID=2024832 RepID=UPI002E30B653|nr:ParB/RepB/Spo0J family partition protein [Geminicoccus sp.]HEX2526382.1 ParB/RepB/Spo0J family partition protein [Geminicoccus sp.]
MSRRKQQPSPILSTSTALIGEASGSLVTRETRFRHSFEAPVDRIEPHPSQARTHFDQGEIEALAATMAEQGQLQPILLSRHPKAKDRWFIVAGERRWRAARHNGWTSILAIEHEGNVEIASLIENLQRVDLTPVEEARGLQHLITDKGYTQSAAAAALGKSKAEISATLRILTLPEDVLDAVLTSELPIAKNTLIELARVEPGSVRERLMALARQGALTVRAIREAQEAPPDDDDDDGADRHERTRRTGKPAGSTIVKLVDRLGMNLVKMLAAGQELDAAERARLSQLRDALDKLLARSGPT